MATGICTYLQYCKDSINRSKLLYKALISKWHLQTSLMSQLSA